VSVSDTFYGVFPFLSALFSVVGLDRREDQPMNPVMTRSIPSLFNEVAAEIFRCAEQELFSESRENARTAWRREGIVFCKAGNLKAPGIRQLFS
jgi:hypothetical protein